MTAIPGGEGHWPRSGLRRTSEAGSADKRWRTIRVRGNRPFEQCRRTWSIEAADPPVANGRPDLLALLVEAVEEYAILMLMIDLDHFK
ncbi:MAG TPA: hypothetical protein VHW26_00975, partial [Solirubrobacteraceae bacterium]|nr:hypothetical protein [Solirubrobacteraceae bacterium]